MNKTKILIGCFRRNESGASAVEFSIVVSVFVFASMGAVELGRTYQVRNELAYAADIGGRKLSIIVNDPSVSPDQYATKIKNEITSTFQGYDSTKLSVAITPETINGITLLP